MVDAGSLADEFELVCGIYEEQEDGRQLTDWLIDDWKLFAVERDRSMILLGDILDDSERVRQNYRPSAMCVSDSLDIWEQLRDELRTRNRFFPGSMFDTDRVGSLLELLLFPNDQVSRTWYRARVEDGIRAFPAEEMGAPPAKRAGPGRANPVGIPYLYVGSRRETAVAEVRPHPGEMLTIAEFTIEGDVQLVDLRDPRDAITPFIMSDSEQVAAVRGDIDFLERLGQELTTPVSPSVAAIDYIPSQYLCEFIKYLGYDGVVYASSVDDGTNIALFQSTKAKVGAISRVKIKDVKFGFNDYISNSLETK